MGTDNIRNIKRESGKGENFVKRSNPFQASFKTSTAPGLDELPNLGLALDVVLNAGCAMLIGHTRDGGAVVLTILDGAERYRTYCTNNDELVAAVKMMHEMYGADV